MCGSDTPAGERERQTHLRQWGQHRAAGWLYLVAGREEAGSPCSHGHAAGARMWSPLPRRCPDLRHGPVIPMVWPGCQRSEPTHGHCPATLAPGSRPRGGSSAFSPPCGAVIVPCRQRAQPLWRRRSRGGAAGWLLSASAALVCAARHADGKRGSSPTEEGWSLAPTPDRRAASSAVTGQGPQHGGCRSLSSSLQQRLPSTVRATMGSLPRASTCITMQACPYTLRACHVTLPLFPPFLLLKMRKTCADITHIFAASQDRAG